ncbi:MAG: hypothetical protein IT289_03375 [Oligoflexia bacterium]|nr:hypothetical protein [Oligoflexia bacterium]
MDCFFCGAISIFRPVCPVCQHIIFKFKPYVQRIKGLPVVSFYPYQEPFVEIIDSLKGGRNKKLAQLLLAIGLEHLIQIDGGDAVIPVPGASRFDHAYILALALSTLKGSNLRVIDSHPKKIKLKQLRAFERWKAAGTKFESPQLCQSGVVIIVDDVITTGATLFHFWKQLNKPPALGLTLCWTPQLH